MIYYIISNVIIISLIYVIHTKNKEILNLKEFKELNQTFIYNNGYKDLKEMLNNNDDELQKLRELNKK